MPLTCDPPRLPPNISRPSHTFPTFYSAVALVAEVRASLGGLFESCLFGAELMAMAGLRTPDAEDRQSTIAIRPFEVWGLMSLPEANTSDPAALFALMQASIRDQVLAVEKRKASQFTAARLFTAKQAGEYIGRTELAVRQMIQKRQIPVVRFGRNVRIDRLDLDRWIDEYKV